MSRIASTGLRIMGIAMAASLAAGGVARRV
jgi:hypothetical protein